MPPTEATTPAASQARKPAADALHRRIAQKIARRGLRMLSKGCYRHAGGENRPVFFDVEETLPRLLEIDRNYDAIRSELSAILPRLDTIPLYHEVDYAQRGISDADELNWRVFFVYLWRQEEKLANAKLFPRTIEVLKGIPGVLNAFFSILEPGKTVPAHEGPSFHYLRYHTAFLVPKNNPPMLRVKDRYHTWREGESLLFDDSWEHEVTNESDDIRVVLIVDVMRPVSFRLRVLNEIVRRMALIAMDDEMCEILFARLGFQDADAKSG